MNELTVFGYPWDVADMGVERFISWAATSGVDRLAVATVYHSANVIAPRRRREVVIEPEANRRHLPLPRPARGPWPPAGRLATEQPRVFDDLAESARSAGIALTGWIVALHNSTLAVSDPSLAVVNCFGDVSTHALCPANPVVADYATALVNAVAGTGHFDEVMVESLNYLPLGHGHPHELSAVRLDPLCRTLASLCFCEHCLAAAARDGIDGASLRDWVAETLHELWNSPVADLREPDEGLELVAMTITRPDLGAWLAGRCRVVTSLVARVSAAARSAGTAITVSGPVFARPLPSAWLEGIDVRAQLAHSDRMLLMPYYEDVAAVARDLDHALLHGSADRFVVAQLLWPGHHGGVQAGLSEKVDLATTLGYRHIALYNFGTAPEPALEWIPALAECLHRPEPT